MKPIFILLLLMLVIPASAVNVSFNNATCGIHIEKDIQVGTDGRLHVDISDVPTNCSVGISTNEYVKVPNYYVPENSRGIKYSDEYYKLDNLATGYISPVEGVLPTWSYPISMALASFYELRRQTILMEKQNELLEEQNGLMRAQMGIKLKCTDLNVGVCGEYTWVTK